MPKREKKFNTKKNLCHLIWDSYAQKRKKSNTKKNLCHLDGLYVQQKIKSADSGLTGKHKTVAVEMNVYMLWFNFILGSNFIFLCFWE